MNRTAPRRHLASACLLLTTAACAGAGADQGAMDPVALALSAAPSEVTANAKVITVDGEVLREGSGAFTCIALEGAPMCLDAAWMKWFEAYVAKTAPPEVGLGISYMLAGDAGASNIDPAATGPTPDNDWVVSGPHLMLLADASALESMTADHRQGGPFVMWKGTPYAHVMVPVGAPSH
jgi:hypothetical protein